LLEEKATRRGSSVLGGARVGLQLGFRILREYVFEGFQEDAAELPDLLVIISKLKVKVDPRYLIGTIRRDAPEPLGEPSVNIQSHGAMRQSRYGALIERHGGG
jgi:hypothetical protein